MQPKPMSGCGSSFPMVIAASLVAFSLSIGSVPSLSAQATRRGVFVAQQQPGWIGLWLQGTEAGDVVVKSVDPGSPAQRAGLLAGDTVLSFNDTKASIMLEDPAQAGIKAGSRVVIKFRRTGAREVTLNAIKPPTPLLTFRIQTPENQPQKASTYTFATPPPEFFVSGSVTTFQNITVGGATLTGVNEDWTDALRTKSDSGVLVLLVAPGTLAMEAGLRSGDLIVRADGVKITTPAAFVQAFRETDGRQMKLEVERKGKIRHVNFRW